MIDTTLDFFDAAWSGAEGVTDKAFSEDKTGKVFRTVCLRLKPFKEAGLQRLHILS